MSNMLISNFSSRIIPLIRRGWTQLLFPIPAMQSCRIPKSVRLCFRFLVRRTVALSTPSWPPFIRTPTPSHPPHPPQLPLPHQFVNWLLRLMWLTRFQLLHPLFIHNPPTGPPSVQHPLPVKTQLVRWSRRCMEISLYPTARYFSLILWVAQ
jgi:hypothetical protein